MMSAAVAASLLTGCVTAGRDRLPAPVSGNPDASALTELLDYAERVRTLPEADLRRELNESLARQRDDLRAEDAIRYALLHVVGNARFADPAAAARALEELTSRSTLDDDEYVAFAAVLQAFLRASVPAPAESVQMSHPSTDRAGARNAELERLRAELDEERARRQALERQLTELRSLEEALSDRAGFENESDSD